MSLLSVRGVYEDGVVRLLAPVEVKGKFDLIVTFVEPVEKDSREAVEEREAQEPPAMRFFSMWADLTPDEETTLEEG
jgi:predicted DNA-binding antitoxin AbrB/MazE fold protein